MRKTIFLAALAACGGGTFGPEQAALDDAREQWGSGLGDYDFRWRQNCECLPETTRPILITVEANAITVARYDDGEGELVSDSVRARLDTVDGVFDTIQEAIDGNAHQITVAYDPNLGHPTSVAIDYEEFTADEELSLQLSNFSAP